MSRSRGRVLFLDHSGLPGGGQLGLRRYLEKSEAYEFCVVQIGPGSTFDALSTEHGGRITKVVKLTLSSSPVRHLLQLRRIAREVSIYKPDWIVSNSTRSTVLLAATPRNGAVRVGYLRDDLNKRRNSRKKLLLLNFLVLPRLDGLIANSEWTASTLSSSRRERTDVRIAYPVSGTVRGDPPNRNLGVVHFLSLSRLDHWKGVHILLEATALLAHQGYRNRFTVTIAGAAHHADPRYADNLKKRTSGIDARITFVGHSPDVQPLLSRSHALVCASLTPEPFGQVVAQGMSAGLVVIATNAGGPAEMLKNGAGILVEPNSAADLAAAMRSVIDRPDESANIARTAQKQSELYCDESTVPMLDAAIFSLRRRRRQRK